MPVKKTARKGKRASSGPTSTREVCFAIMPFGGWLDDYYETIYSPAIIAAGLDPHRADDLYRPSTIVHDIWAYTKKAKLLVADLTGKNPNVFYELGLAHALAKPAILVAESMDDIPFDLRALRVIIYDKNAPDWGSLLRKKIEASIKEVMQSPVEAVLPAFLDVKEAAGRPAVTSHEKEIIEIKQELDLLRRELRGSKDLRYLEERSGRVIDIDEARALLREYSRMGMPTELIVERLSASGVPPDWVIEQLKRIVPQRVRGKSQPVTTRTRKRGA